MANRVRGKMAPALRAKQFLPFSALSGLSEALEKRERAAAPKIDLTEDMAAEEKARTTYDNILRLSVDSPDVTDAIRFLRAREVVHFQRFGEALRIVQDHLDERNFYAFNPAFDTNGGKPGCK